MAGDGIQPHAVRQFTLDVRHHGERRLLQRRERRGLAEQHGIDRQQAPRLLIGGAAHHHAVERADVLPRLFDTGDAAIEHDAKIGVRGFQPMHDLIVERRHLAIFLRRQPLQPGLARMHDQRVGPGPLHHFGERKQHLVRVLLVDADAAFDRHRDIHRRLHGSNTVADQRRLVHQAGAEATFLHPVGRAADIEVDFVVAEAFADAGALRQRGRLRAAELQRHRVFACIEAKKPVAVAMQDGAGGQHLGIEQRPARHEPMEEPAMPVGPVHHRVQY